MNIGVLKRQVVEIILYGLVRIGKDCSRFPVKTNNEQLAALGCCRTELLPSLVQGMNFKHK